MIKGVRLMRWRKRSFVWILLAALFVVLLYFLLAKAVERTTHTSGAGDLEKQQTDDIGADNKAEGSWSKEFLNPGSAGAASGIDPTEEEDTRLTVGKPYKTKLVGDNSTNILIVGEDKTSYLYDTIGIVSIDAEEGKIRIIMLPRDTYIEYNKRIMDFLDKAGKLREPGFLKINNAHHIGAMIKYEGKFKTHSMSFLADIIKEKLGIEVKDYVKINTRGFVEIVDLFGGVDINVPYDMNYDDPLQDLSIHLKKGLQHLDGKQAEGFVRYRQGYDENGVFREYGDTERKKNQILFLKEFIKQHGTVRNIDKIPELMKVLGKNIDHSVGFGDILLNYIGLLKDVVVKKYEIESVNIDGKSQWIYGSSYIIIDQED